jgi:hypothetical protein
MYQNKTIVITQQQINQFCDSINDTNIIHRQDQRSIVPGMLTTSLIFENPSDYWRLAKMDNRYRFPVYSGIPVIYNYELIFEKPKLKKYKIQVYQNQNLCLESEILIVKKET